MPKTNTRNEAGEGVCVLHSSCLVSASFCLSARQRFIIGNFIILTGCQLVPRTNWELFYNQVKTS